MTSQDVAKQFGVTLMTVNRWVREGLIAPVTDTTPQRRRRPPLKFYENEVNRFASERAQAMSQPEKRKPRK